MYRYLGRKTAGSLRQIQDAGAKGPEYLSKLEMNDLRSRDTIEVGVDTKVNLELIVDSGASCNIRNHMLSEHLKLRFIKCKCF